MDDILLSAMAGLASLFAERVVDEIAGNAAKPGAQFFRFAEVTQLLPGGDKGVLCQIFTLAQAAGGAVSEGAD